MCYSCMTYSQASKNDFFSSGKFWNQSMMINYRFNFFQLIERVSSNKVCHLSQTYLLIKGLKLLKGILKSVASKFNDSSALLSTFSLP